MHQMLLRLPPLPPPLVFFHACLCRVFFDIRSRITEDAVYSIISFEFISNFLMNDTFIAMNVNAVVTANTHDCIDDYKFASVNLAAIDDKICVLVAHFVIN